MDYEEKITPRNILEMLMDDIVLPEDQWARVIRKFESKLAVEWEITLDTELVEA